MTSDSRDLVVSVPSERLAEDLAPNRLERAKLKVHDKIKCLIVLGEDYTSYAGDAAWADTKFGLSHLRDFARVALVTDVGRMKQAAELFGWLMPGEFRTFPLAELDAAESRWLELQG